MLLQVAILLCTGTALAKYNGPSNQAGLNLIKEFEGWRPNFYIDPVGVKTIGYGHACHANNCKVPINGKYRPPLSKAEGEALLKSDLASYESCVKRSVTYSGLNANQFSALASFTFNLGCGSLQSSTLLKKLNAGDTAGTSREFAKWVKGGGKTLPGLVRRREAERKLFCASGGCGGSGGGGSSCSGTVSTTSQSLTVRKEPNTSAAVAGSLAKGAKVSISGRVNGANVSGNSHWFKVPNGYVSAFYISPSGSASWCKK